MPKETKNSRPFIGHQGWLKCSAIVQGEAPIWCPVKIIAAHEAFGRIDVLVEPVGGYGTMKVRATRVWIDDTKLNHCKEVPS